MLYLADGASLAGFTLANGATRGAEDLTAVPYQQASGGGLWSDSTNALVTNSVLVGNSARWDGGGAHGGTLYNCTLTGNSASVSGGRVAFSTLINSTLTGNSAWDGGGARNGTLNNCLVTGNTASGDGGGAFGEWGGVLLNNCTLKGNSAAGDVHRGGGGVVGGIWGGAGLNNCIIYSNTAPNDANYGHNVFLNYCCTTPLPESGRGVGNMTNAPLFVNEAAGNYRLRSDSPCVNAGNHANAPGPSDLDGQPSIANGTLDIRAYEFPAPAPGSWTRKTTCRLPLLAMPLALWTGCFM